jgi:hypothetical protein
MAKNETTRLRPLYLQEDKDAFVALRALSDYRPANPAYEVAAIEATQTAMISAQEAETRADAALAAARDTAVAKEWEYHNLMLGAKVQVKAQYGENSNQVQGMGLKKKSEYKAPGGKDKAPTPDK